jgi:hypothetical protein
MNNQHLDEDNDRKYGSATSTLSSGYGQVYGGFPQGDENLPEVRIDTSPQALSHLEAEYKRRHLEEHEPKYPVIYDNAPKTVVPAEGSLPSESVTAGEREQAPSAEGPPAKNGKICGLTRRMFFIVLAILLVIIAAGVGGGVGGAVSSSTSKNKSPAPITTTSSEPSSG